jgi:hypothetical protein
MTFVHELRQLKQMKLHLMPVLSLPGRVKENGNKRKTIAKLLKELDSFYYLLAGSA